MAHKKKDAPRKLYARAKTPFICYAGQYFAPELRDKSLIKLDAGDITVVEILEGEGDEATLVALEGTTTAGVTERLTPFVFERKTREAKAAEPPVEAATETAAEAPTAEVDPGQLAVEADGDEDTCEADAEQFSGQVDEEDELLAEDDDGDFVVPEGTSVERPREEEEDCEDSVSAVA